MNFRAITWQHVTREFRTLALKFNYATFTLQTMHCTRLIILQYQKRLREQAMNYRVEHPVFSVRHHHVVRVRVESYAIAFVLRCKIVTHVFNVTCRHIPGTILRN